MIPKLPRGFSHPMRIGEGAFASVYRVRQKALDRWVAIKFIHQRNRKKRNDLLREAKVQAKIRSECIPQIYDAFEWRESVCIIMQWIKGVSLATLLESFLTSEEKISLAGGFITSLANLHSLGFAHRDLKPANILISPENGIYLVDFGFTKNVLDGTRSVAMTAKGTPAYMAPEIWKFGSNVDLMRADIYSAGKILHQLLSSTHAHSFTEQLLEENPDRRPGSGLELLKLWKAADWYSPAETEWGKIAADPTSELLSVKLLLAAKELMYLHRYDEAYWLLVESLEENADNGEALEMIDRFPKQSRKRKNITLYGSAISAVAAAIISAFLMGRKARDGFEPVIYSSGQEIRNLLSINKESALLPLKEDSIRTGLISGYLAVEGYNGGVLTINEIPWSGSLDELRSGIKLPGGVHELALIDNNGKIRWYHRVSLLPFQKKVVTVSAKKDFQKQ